MTQVTFLNASGASTKHVWYEYDVFGRRILKQVDVNGNGTSDREEHFLYEDSPTSELDGIALVLDENEDVIHRYLHASDVDQLFADENALGEVLWNLTDHQGTVRDIVEFAETTSTTSVMKHIKYGAFGNIESVEDGTGSVIANGKSEIQYAYTGREWDADADLYYYRARWYDASAGRFISEDPTDFAAGDANLQRYVENGSPNAVDPRGLQETQKGVRNEWRCPWEFTGFLR